MPIILYSLAGLLVVAGAAMIGFGIPNNEFGIGNTLIVAGTTFFAAGFVVFAVGVAVAQLVRIAEALATRAPIRSSRPFETFDPVAARAAAPERAPFPPKTKAEPQAPEPRMEMPQPAAAPMHDYAAPTLSNPDEPPVTVADEAYLSPLHPATPTPFSRDEHDEPEFPKNSASKDDDADTSAAADMDRAEPELPPPLTPRKSTYFDAMWPTESKASEPKPVEPKSVEPEAFEPKAFEPKLFEPMPS